MRVEQKKIEINLKAFFYYNSLNFGKRILLLRKKVQYSRSNIELRKYIYL